MLANASTITLLLLAAGAGAHPHAAPGVTSLTNPSVKYATPPEHYVEIRRGPVRIVIVDNEAIDSPALSGHRAGYNGVASLTHASRDENLFVPSVAGLNFEHIHDGTLAVDKERFEPRRSPMRLRVIDEFTVEVYQPPTENWKLESCGRYHLLEDGVIEYTFECIPRAETFQQKYIGLFWASYIERPEDKAIQFIGREKSNEGGAEWLRATSPAHGVDSTHPPEGPLADLDIDPRFSLTLVNHPSRYAYTEPWYFGVSHGMAYVQMFRDRDQIWFAQSPTGGGETNPAWDFQWFIPDYKVGEAYGFVMRAAYLPFESREQIATATREHRDKLNGDLPEVDRTGFKKIFDGKTLEKWDGDPTYWSVSEEKLVGVVTPETLLKKNSWIVYRGELVEDFELVLDYRVSAEGNSGVGYRLAVLKDDPVSVRGPQADIHGADMFTGICYEENGRRLLAARGQATRIEPNEPPRLIAQFADAEELQSVVRKEDWNRYRLVVRGADAQHYLNGVLISEIHDHDEPNRMKLGLIGVQVHVGPPMKIEYRDIYLKHLGPKPAGIAARDSVTYKPGALREPDHGETFENLVRQTSRLTTPRSNEPLGGKRDLTLESARLAIVRSDLADLKLFGGSKPLPSGDADYDLIVMTDDQTVRVPKAGGEWIGKPLDQSFRVLLEWDEKLKGYRVKTVAAAQSPADESRK